MSKNAENIITTTDELVLEEVKRMNRYLKKMDLKTRKLVEKLVKNVAFMAITLEKLIKIINFEGFTCTYQNGKDQYGTKQTPEIDIYNRTIKNYNSTLKTITDLLPKNELIIDDGFNKFIENK